MGSGIKRFQQLLFLEIINKTQFLANKTGAILVRGKKTATASTNVP
jgi:hypothetical protein